MSRFFESIGAVDNERFYSAVLAWTLSRDCLALDDGQKYDIARIFLPTGLQGHDGTVTDAVAESKRVDLRLQIQIGGKPIEVIVENKLKATYRKDQLQDIMRAEKIDGVSRHLCTLTLFEDEESQWKEIAGTGATNATYRTLYEAFPTRGLGIVEDPERARQGAILQEFREALGRIAALHDLLSDSFPQSRLNRLLQLIPLSIGCSKSDRDQLWQDLLSDSIPQSRLDQLLRLIPTSMRRHTTDREKLWMELRESLNEDPESIELLVRWGFDKPFIRAHFQTIASYLNGFIENERRHWTVGETRGKPHISRVLSEAGRRDDDQIELNWGIQVQFPDTCKLVLAIREGYEDSSKDQIRNRIAWLGTIDPRLLTGNGTTVSTRWKLNRPKRHAYCSLSYNLTDLVQSSPAWWIGSRETCGQHLQSAGEVLSNMVRAIEETGGNQVLSP